MTFATSRMSALRAVCAAVFFASVCCGASSADEDDDAEAAELHPCAALPLASDEALECWIEDQCAEAEGVAARAACVNRIVTWREGALRDINAQTPAFYQGAPSPLRARTDARGEDGEDESSDSDEGDSEG